MHLTNLLRADFCQFSFILKLSQKIEINQNVDKIGTLLRNGAAKSIRKEVFNCPTNRKLKRNV